MAEKYKTISNLQRKPSMLSVLDPITETRPGSRRSRRGSDSPGSEHRDVREWGREEVTAWLEETGMREYQVRECGHQLRL